MNLQKDSEGKNTLRKKIKEHKSVNNSAKGVGKRKVWEKPR